MLLEQGRLTCGTTWHAAGLVGQLRAHQNMTRLVQYSAELYQKLEAETGQATGWKQCGSVLVARTPERVTLFKRIHAAARAQGVACEIISIDEAARKYPVMRTDDLLGALWLPDDAKVNPADVTQALARGARRMARASSSRPASRRSIRRTASRPALRPRAATSRPRS